MHALPEHMIQDVERVIPLGIFLWQGLRFWHLAWDDGPGFSCCYD